MDARFLFMIETSDFRNLCLFESDQTFFISRVYCLSVFSDAPTADVLEWFVNDESCEKRMGCHVCDLKIPEVRACSTVPYANEKHITFIVFSCVPRILAIDEQHRRLFHYPPSI